MAATSARASTTTDVVRIAGLTVRYGDATALDGLDLVVGAGERVALVGSSGAGKTTLLGALGGLVAPTEGRVEVLGTVVADTDAPTSPVRGRARRRHQRRIGYVRQQLDLALPLAVIHNVNGGRLGQWSTARALGALVWPRNRDEVGAVLDQLGLADRIGERTEYLSGGQRQRVAVARALHQRPDLLLADEPTASVDPRLSDLVMDLLAAPEPTRAPWTLIASLHEPDLARRHATRLIGLENGRVVLDARPDEVDDAELTRLYADRP
ncbi:MAG: ATP-binding cassette domain-containing protein [Actinomycetota bacterium]